MLKATVGNANCEKMLLFVVDIVFVLSCPIPRFTALVTHCHHMQVDLNYITLEHFVQNVFGKEQLREVA